MHVRHISLVDGGAPDISTLLHDTRTLTWGGMHLCLELPRTAEWTAT